MSGDLEDFLRRAAQRRQAKAAPSPQPTDRPRPRPQYTDSRTERTVRNIDAEEAYDEVLAAQVIEAEDPNSIAARRRRLEQAQAEAARAQAEAAEKLQKAGMGSRSAGGTAAAITGQTDADLLTALASRTGLRQAILLREILDRPTHRW